MKSHHFNMSQDGAKFRMLRAAEVVSLGTPYGGIHP